MKVLRAHVLLLLALSACTGENTPSSEEASEVPAHQIPQPTSATRSDHQNKADSAAQISQYIRRMFQDRDGNMWFGTTSDGVARLDGRNLEYFTPDNGFSSNWVSSMIQDAHGDLWFGTGGGVSRYDGQLFTNYTTKDGLASDQVWCTLLDKSGGLWFGTEEGVSRFDPSASLRTSGIAFASFPIPAADLSKFPYYKYPKQINWMIQDKAGNIWFASNGGGAYLFDGKTLTNLTEKDGLCNNFVETILEDRDGNLWFGTRYGGLCKYDGRTFTTFTRNELKGDGVWTLYQTSDGIIWISVTRAGLCSYNGVSFTCYDEKDGEGIRVVQSLLEDANGQLWVGTSNGVYRWDGVRFTNWTREEALGG